MQSLKEILNFQRKIQRECYPKSKDWFDNGISAGYSDAIKEMRKHIKNKDATIKNFLAQLYVDCLEEYHCAFRERSDIYDRGYAEGYRNCVKAVFESFVTERMERIYLFRTIAEIKHH